VALSGLCDSGFLVTLGDCHHLADLVLLVDRSTALLVVVDASDHWLL
jgi:hypothetical protein